MSVCCEGCVLSGSGLCIGLITRPESPTDCGVSNECDHESSIMRRPWPTGGGGCCAVVNKGAADWLSIMHGTNSIKSTWPHITEHNNHLN